MLVRFLLVMLCFFSLSAFADDDEEMFKLMETEVIGPWKLGDSKKDVLKHLKKKLTLSKIEFSQVDGGYDQRVESPSEGVILVFKSDTPNSMQTLASIDIRPPSQFATSANIKIGSAEAEVFKAYRSYYNKEESQSGKYFVAGSIYGGLIFELKAGRVAGFFLGAAAE